MRLRERLVAIVFIVTVSCSHRTAATNVVGRYTPTAQSKPNFVIYRCPFACMCNNSLRNIHCVSDYYREVPPLPRETRNLLIKGITNLQDHAFESCPKVRVIEIKTALKKVQKDAFKGLRGLYSLTVRHTFIDRLSPDIFRNAINLVHIELDHNFFAEIPDKPFCHTPNLQSLRLDSNRITTFRFGVCYLLLNKLVRLILDGNKATILRSEGFLNLRNSPIRILSLVSCNITLLSRDIFYNLPNLELLNLNNNHVKQIVERTFEPLQHLQTLSLSGNRLTDISFQNLTFKNMSNLSLRNNIFVSLDRSTLSSFRGPNMKYFDIKECGIHNVSKDALHGFPNLNTLDLRYNKFNKLAMKNVLISLNGNNNTLKSLYISIYSKVVNMYTFNLSKLKKLKLLHVTGDISELDIQSFIHFPTLRELTIEKCNLRYITPGAFRGLAQLEKLQLVENALTSLPQFHLKNLRNLDLSGNRLVKFRQKNPFIFLSNLEVLSLAKNGLQEKDISCSMFYGLNNLKKLDLSQNQLHDTFNRWLSPLKPLQTLETLVLYGNDIDRFHIDTFDDLINLKYLDLSRNNFRNKEHALSGVFKKLTNLQTLYMESCELSALPVDIFATLTSLTTLFIGKNSISSLHPDVFNSLTKLRNLGLDSNQISAIEYTSLSHLDSLQILDLSHNPFDCSCGILWFRDWIETTHVDLFFQYSTMPKQHIYSCDSPKNRKGKSLFDFQIAVNECTHNNRHLALVSIVPLILVITACICIAIRCRWHLRYLCFLVRSRRKKFTEARANDKPFDAFVCYHADDLNWIIYSLLPNIEYNGGFKLCLHHRNWSVGVDIVANIVESIENSRKTILVLTNKFARSKWCQLEAALAQHAYLDDNRDIVIMVILEKIKSENMNDRLYSLFQTKTYIEWTDSVKGQALFWKRLRRAIMKPEHHGNIELITTDAE